jgi:hypothetical protein
MCGHACCCPEACAKERKAKMDEAKACGMAFCELPAPTPSNLAQVLTEERLWKDPQMRGAGRDLVVADNAKSRIAGETTFFSTPSFKEIPTPPPRRLA